MSLLDVLGLPPLPAFAPPVPPKVTIVNEVGVGLVLKSSRIAGPSTFLSEPPTNVDGGRSASFEVLLDPGVPIDPAGPASSGSVTYAFALENAAEPNAPGVVQTVTLRWNGDQWSGRIEPGAAALTVQSGGTHGDYVFTVVGPELAFAPPPKAGEPTLRRGDASADGWVEYLQEILNVRVGPRLKIDGVFGARTFAAVQDFQRKFRKQGVLVDGVVGDQTWSYLREGAPAKAKTDGRKPQGFVEAGAAARWFSEKPPVLYDYSADSLFVLAMSVGDVEMIESRQVRLRIVSPSGAQKVVERPVGAGLSTTSATREHMISVARFSSLFDADIATGLALPGDYQVSGYFPADLGGDAFSAVLNVFEVPSRSATPA